MPSVIALGPKDRWVVAKGGRVEYGAVPGALRRHLDQLSRTRVPIREVAFAPGDGWVVVSDQGTMTDGVPEGFSRDLDRVADAGGVPTAVVFKNNRTSAPRWLIAHSGKGGLVGNLQAHPVSAVLLGAALAGKTVRDIALGPNNSFVVLADDEIFTGGIEPGSELGQQLKRISDQNLMPRSVSFLPRANRPEFGVILVYENVLWGRGRAPMFLGLAIENLLRASGNIKHAFPVLGGGPDDAYIAAYGEQFKFSPARPSDREELRRDLEELAPFGFSEVAMTPDGGWLLLADHRDALHNLDERFVRQLRDIRLRKYDIHAVAFNPVNWETDRGFIIAHSGGVSAHSVPRVLVTETQVRV
ncbi:MAG: hypothetical protein AAFY60_15990, partial [Myxococcota bacterium]